MGKDDRAFDMSEIRHIERVVIGSHQATGDVNEDKEIAQVNKLNSLLQGFPKGMLIGKTISFKVYKLGENSVIAQQVSYLIGFKRPFD